MPFTIPNLATAAFADQAQVDAVDLLILAYGTKQDGVVSGGAVTSTGAANGSLSVAVGQVRIADRLYTLTATTPLAVTANATGNTRYDLVTVTATGTPVVTAGTASATPVFPVPPAGSVVLAAVRVATGHTTGTTIAANTIVDKRLDTTAALAGPVDNTAYRSIYAPGYNRPALRIYGGPASGGTQNFQLMEWLDYLGAPIAWLNTAGGFFVNDYIRTSYSVFGPDNFITDIYGTVWQSGRASYAFSGPPGNMMSFADACHENHQLARDRTVAGWTVVAGCTLATLDLGAGAASPTRLRSALRMTNTASGTGWINQNGGAFALSGVTTGMVISGVAWLRSGTAAAARTATIRLSFFDSTGTQQGTDFNSANVSIPNTGVWTKVAIDGIVVPPTNATLVQISILLTAVAGETHDVCGVGIMKNSQTGVFGPPFVFQDATTGGASPGGEGVALAGARWNRTDVPTIPGNREYTCHTGGAPNAQVWGSIDTSSLYRLDADVSSTSVTVAAISPFNVVVAASGSYVFEYELFLVSAALTTGWILGFTGPASPTSFFATCEYQSAASGTAGWTTNTRQSLGNFSTVLNSYVATPSMIRIRISALLVNGANAGTLSLVFASEVAASTVTIKKGSLLSVT